MNSDRLYKGELIVVAANNWEEAETLINKKKWDRSEEFKIDENTKPSIIDFGS